MVYRENVRVKIVEGKYEGEVGTIYGDNLDGAVVLIKLKNGELVKVLPSDVELFKDEDDRGVVTLTREKLREAICEVSAPEKFEGYFKDKSKATILSLSAGVIGKELERYFFGEVEND